MFKKFMKWVKSVIKALSPWAKQFAESVVSDVVVPLAKNISKKAVKLFFELFIEAAKNEDMSGTEKQQWVAEQFRDRWKGEVIKDSLLDAAQGVLYIQYKNNS